MAVQQPLAPPPPPAPLADRMRPRTLDEYIGQEHIVGPGRLLRRAIEADQLSSIILHGPPGTGKTTLARVIAGSTKARFTALNAVLAGVADLREAIAAARELRDSHGRRTILFVDEVHRFNKAQQDALLPWVESGVVILIGATTENPFFEVNKALVSRSRLFQLRALGPEDLRGVARQALRDPERGYGRLVVDLDPQALEHLVDVAGGDARALLNALELAVQTTPPGPEGRLRIDLPIAEESIQRRAVLYDKEGDAHFDTISAFIKSVRGSDPDAALYWLARMVVAGEDPRFILRRLIILASEDIGLADPAAVGVVMACAAAYDRVGMPEGRYPLAQATLYLAGTAKSNSTMGFFDALAAVEGEKAGEVPLHLRDKSRDGAAFGHGEGYQYPHAFRDHWVAQQYLPSTLQGRLFYQPSDQGWEREVGPRLARQREEQLAVAVSEESEVFTFGPVDSRVEQWAERTAGQAGARLSALREAIFAVAPVQRHHRVLDLGGHAGLVAWEALRRAPEGGVWVLAGPQDPVRALAERLPAMGRPICVEEVGAELRFEWILGLSRPVEGVECLAPGGRVVLVESFARDTPRLSGWLQGPQAWAAAEEAVYTDPADPLTARSVEQAKAQLEGLGLSVQVERLPQSQELLVRPELLRRWLSPSPGSWLSRLRARLGDTQALEAAVRRLEGRTLHWEGLAWRVVGLSVG